MKKPSKLYITGGSSGIGLALYYTQAVASEVANGLGRSKAVIVPGARAKLSVWLARVFPEIFAWSGNLLLRGKFR